MLRYSRRFFTQVISWLRSRPCGGEFAISPFDRQPLIPDGEGIPREMSANELCDELLCHMLECTSCLDPAARCCPIYSQFQDLIGLRGGATAPVLLAV